MSGKRKIFENKGFTLLELAIVIVIIGLLISAVLVGQTLINAARLRSVVTDIKDYTSAVNLFRDKYAFLPGDMPNADDYWPNCADAMAMQTCNGNENGQINEGNNEGLRAWQLLGLSGLISKNYTGVDAGMPDMQIDVNVPASRIDGGGYRIYYGTYYGRSFNLIHFASEHATGNLSEGILIPTDAYSIDNKIDDGLNYAGEILTRSGASTPNTCVTADDMTPSAYVLTSESPNCRMYFWFD